MALCWRGPWPSSACGWATACGTGQGGTLSSSACITSSGSCWKTSRNPSPLRWAERFHVNRECLPTGVPDCPHGGAGLHRRAVFPGRWPAGRAGHVPKDGHRVLPLTTLRDGTIFSLGLDKKRLPGGVFDLGGGLCRGSPSGAGATTSGKNCLSGVWRFSGWSAMG